MMAKTKGTQPKEGTIRKLIQLNEGDDKKLEIIAANYDYIADRGERVGQGSLSAFMRAIASGEVVVIKVQKS